MQVCVRRFVIFSCNLVHSHNVSNHNHNTYIMITNQLIINIIPIVSQVRVSNNLV